MWNLTQLGDTQGLFWTCAEAAFLEYPDRWPGYFHFGLGIFRGLGIIGPSVLKGWGQGTLT